MIYIITTESFPNGMAATQRIRCYAKAISKREKCVVLVANRLEKPDSPLGNTDTEGELNGYSYKYCGSSTLKPNGRINSLVTRFLDILRLCRYLFVNLHRGDSVIFYSYNLSLMKIVVWIAHFKNAKFYYELCEHPSIQCLGYPKDSEEEGLRWFKHNFRSVDGMFVISHTLQVLVKRVFSKEMKTLLLPILYEEEINPIIKPFENNGVPYILHTGSLTQRKDGILDSLTAYSAIMRESEINLDYILTGNLEASPDCAKIKEIVGERHIKDHVKFVGYLSADDMLSYQKGASLTIINKRDNLQNRYCFATKIGEYLRAGCLMLITSIGETVHYLNDGVDCLYFEPDNKESLVRKIKLAALDKDSHDKIAQQGKKSAQKFFYCERYTDSIVEFIVHK